MIEFFCPNGHHIRVDAALAGKSGPCSKCGTRVTIPKAGDPPGDDMPVLEVELQPIEAPVPVGAAAEPDLSSLHMAEPSSEEPWHPSADLVSRLWAEREHGGVVEVHHADGVIVPEWYDVAWSRGTYGLFGSQAADGTVTITAVAWDSVKKVIVRGVKTLPADMFPG